MGLLSKLGSLVLSQRSSQPGTSLTSTPSSPTSPAQKSLQELEQEILAQYGSHPQKSAVPRRKSGLIKKLTWTLLLIGVPTGIVWMINLPYPPIRRPIARTAPILLLPSYARMDHSYREALRLVEQAEQLVDRASSAADIDLGAQKVAEAKKHLDQLPLWLWDELPGYQSWGYGRMNYAGFNTARGDLGRLEAKVFQERNAQTRLVEAEQSLERAKQQYQQAKTGATQLVAISGWRTALEQLEQVSAQTVAGRIAEQKLVGYQQELQDLAGVAADNQQTFVYIQSAREYGRKAAEASQNPPHPVETWQRVEAMWQEAIEQLDRVSTADQVGYATAQKLRAQYQDNLLQIRIRREQEANAAQALQQANQSIQALLASTPDDVKLFDRNTTISQLQGIINQLKLVENGTTSYSKAQTLLLQAQNKLQQLQTQSP